MKYTWAQFGLIMLFCTALASPAAADRPYSDDVRQSMYQFMQSHDGLSEIEGEENEPIIVQMHGFTQLGSVPDEVPWCSSALNMAADVAGVDGTGSALARSWLTWGAAIDLENAKIGDVVVFSRGSDPSAGHVGLFAGIKGNQILVLGGNQGNKIQISAFPASRLIAVRTYRYASV